METRSVAMLRAEKKPAGATRAKKEKSAEKMLSEKGFGAIRGATTWKKGAMITAAK